MIGGSILGVVVIAGYLYNEANNSFKQKNGRELSVTEWAGSMYDPKLIQLIIGTLIVVGVLGGISFNLYKKEHAKNFATVTGEATSTIQKMIWWVNNQAPNDTGDDVKTPLTMTMIGVSMVFGVIFGFIDNAGLFFGMDALDPYVKKVSKDPKVAAGIGNTFSDVIGAFAGSFAGSVVTSLFKTSIGECFEGPMWAEAVGIFIGCIIGIIIPKAITS